MLKSHLKATSQSIGMVGIPRDNSYALNLDNQEEAYITGKGVLIISMPYQETIKSRRARSKPIKREFVNVSFQSQVYRVINDFLGIYPRR